MRPASLKASSNSADVAPVLPTSKGIQLSISLRTAPTTRMTSNRWIETRVSATSCTTPKLPVARMRQTLREGSQRRAIVTVGRSDLGLRDMQHSPQVSYRPGQPDPGARTGNDQIVA